MHLILLLPFLLFGYVSNNYISVSTHKLAYKQKKKQEKKRVSSLSIVHISDLHNKTFGWRQTRLLNKIKAIHPDIIVITGDLVDGAPHHHAAVFLQKASRICPIYFVRGNHESIAGNFPVLNQTFSKCNVHLLVNRSVDVTKDGYTYRISGLDDPIFHIKGKKYAGFIKKTLDEMLDKLKRTKKRADFQILLSHRPELFSLYSRYPFDLVLCGHAHGGQVRLPFTDGLYAPNQGILPKYTSGAHTKNNTTEIISRGLGNSSFPLRLFNFPEIVHIQITLSS